MAKRKKINSVKKVKESETELPQIPFYTQEQVKKEEPIVVELKFEEPIVTAQVVQEPIYVQPINDIKIPEDFTYHDEKKQLFEEPKEEVDFSDSIVQEEPKEEGFLKKNKRSLLFVVGMVLILFMGFWMVNDIKKPEQELTPKQIDTVYVESIVEIDTIQYITVINEVTDSLVKTEVKLEKTKKELKKTKKELKNTKKELKETDHYAEFVFEQYKKAVLMLLDSNRVPNKVKTDTVVVSRPGE